MTMTNVLTELGWGEPYQSAFESRGVASEIPGRVIEEQRGKYVVACEHGELLATISGKLRHQALHRVDFPTVGDWVAIIARPAEKTATLEAILPRRSKLSRKTSGQQLDEQLIAANLDRVFIVTSLNKEFNARRVERYLALISDSGATAAILLNKVDLCADRASALKELEAAAPGVPVYPLSATTGVGVEALEALLKRGETVALLGSSGVGKSTLTNRLLGHSRQAVRSVRPTDDRGRHTTTFRRLVVLPQGGLLMDTPGMRELQLWESHGVEDAFMDVRLLIDACRFTTCKHGTDAGCAVQEAVRDGRLPLERFDHFVKLKREAAHLAEQREKEARMKSNQKFKRTRAAYKKEPRD